MSKLKIKLSNNELVEVNVLKSAGEFVIHDRVKDDRKVWHVDRHYAVTHGPTSIKYGDFLSFKSAEEFLQKLSKLLHGKKITATTKEQLYKQVGVKIYEDIEKLCHYYKF